MQVDLAAAAMAGGLSANVAVVEDACAAIAKMPGLGATPALGLAGLAENQVIARWGSTPFSLTPALSRWERGNRWPRC